MMRYISRIRTRFSSARLWSSLTSSGRLIVGHGSRCQFSYDSCVNILRQHTLRFGVGSRLVMEPGSSLTLHGDFSFADRCTVIVHQGGHLSLGAGGWCLHDCWLEVSPNGHIHIGDRSTLQLRCNFHGSVSIGHDVLCAPDVYASSGGHRFDADPARTIREQDALVPLHHRPVLIGDRCWLGLRTWIAPGVQLADGTVTGANSVVTHDTRAFSVYAGIPAKLLRTYA